MHWMMIILNSQCRPLFPNLKGLEEKYNGISFFVWVGVGWEMIFTISGSLLLVEESLPKLAKQFRLVNVYQWRWIGWIMWSCSMDPEDYSEDLGVIWDNTGVIDGLSADDVDLFYGIVMLSRRGRDTSSTILEVGWPPPHVRALDYANLQLGNFYITWTETLHSASHFLSVLLPTWARYLTDTKQMGSDDVLISSSSVIGPCFECIWAIGLAGHFLQTAWIWQLGLLAQRGKTSSSRKVTPACKGLGLVQFFHWFRLDMTYGGACGCILVILDAANVPSLWDDC